MAMRRLSISPSTAVARMDYDNDSKRLLIEWADGRLDAYESVPPEIADGAEAAPSVGRFVNQVVKPLFRTTTH